MERKLRLRIAYDGTDFRGWQRQPGVRTVQQVVEETLQRVLRHPLTTEGASRTDAGVHARGQVVAVVTASPIPAANLCRAVDHRLPADVALLDVVDCNLAFRPARDAVAKLYRYRIHNAASRPVATLSQRYAWHVWHPLDSDRMRAAAAAMVGTHDFAAFANRGSPRESTVRTVRRVDIRRVGPEHEPGAQAMGHTIIDVEGDGFLYNQVRNMVGTLVDVGRGHWPPERVTEILATGQRRLAGPTAPPHGLCLQWVRYAGDREWTDEAD